MPNPSYSVTVDHAEGRAQITFGDVGGDDVIVNIEPAPIGDAIMVLRRAIASPGVFSPIPPSLIDSRVGSLGYGVSTEVSGHRVSLLRFVPASDQLPALKAADVVLLVAFALRSTL